MHIRNFLCGFLAFLNFDTFYTRIREQQHLYPKKSLILKLLKENLLNLTKIGVQIVMKKFLCKNISKICVALKCYPKVHTVFNKFFVCEKLYNIK